MIYIFLMMEKEKSINFAVTNYSHPLAFSQVREDPLLDMQVLDSLDRDRLKVLMIASGGETLCKIAAQKKTFKIDAVDANRSQILLSGLKLKLLRKSPEFRRQLLGYSPMNRNDRQSALDLELHNLGGEPDLLCRTEELYNKGPDFCGRYELLFSEIQKELNVTPEYIQSMCGKEMKEEFKVRLQVIFEKCFDLDQLVHLFGKEATQNPVLPFADHFFERTVSFIEGQYSSDSPFLYQMLTGGFYGNCYSWLNLPENTAACPVTFHNAMMGDFVKNCNAEYDFIHLSNILDWLNHSQAQELMLNVHRLLAQGGKVIIRQLNSSLNVKAAGPFFNWEENSLDRNDKSFFYKAIHIGEKP